jgi:hypothetical protein
MPKVDFSALPGRARLWVFGADSPLGAEASERLLGAVDAHLEEWLAHGVPLVCARDWRDHRFLAIGVDEAATGASGCSIDGLFRVLTALQAELGTALVGGGRVFWRDASGAVHRGDRGDFADACRRGEVRASTPVFDTTVATVDEWRGSFERPAASSWHARLMPILESTTGS